MYFAAAELIGDTGSNTSALAYKLENYIPSQAEMLVLCQTILEHLTRGAETKNVPLTQQRLVHDERSAMPEDGVVCRDNGMYEIWSARHFARR
jgi:acetolactate synthase I/II/III large subunit